jgi:REP element-mobilizing transposase RayT
MARPLRILVAGGWYHVTSRGNRRQTLFHNDADRRSFMGLVEQLPERFRLEVHAFALMDNHYHLVVHTPQPNLSDAMRWLNVSYSSRYNWAHKETGHVFQGHYKAIIIEDLSGVVAVARYVHLNPVRVGRLALNKAQQKYAKVVGGVDPGAELVRERLKELRSYRWSSWRVYSGAEKRPGWLETSTIAAGCGGRTVAERRQALRQYTEAPIRQGRLDSPWTELVGGLALGSEDFVKRLLKGRPVDFQEQTVARRVARIQRVPWPEIVGSAEELLGRTWKEMLTRRGDWGRDATIYVAVRYGGYRLPEVIKQLPGLKYQAAAQGVRRFQRKWSKKKERFVERLKHKVCASDGL